MALDGPYPQHPDLGFRGQIFPWSWESRFCLIGISQGGRYRRGISFKNHFWDGQNGAMRWKPLSLTLHRTVGISLTGGNVQSLMSGQGWENAYMPRGAGELREKQSGHWDDSCDAKRSTSALPNKSKIWATIWWFNIHSPDLNFCLHRKLAARIKTHETWTAQLQAVYVPEEELLVQTSHAGLPSKTAPQPVRNASIVTIWRQWIAPILTPLWRKRGYRHNKRVRKQLRDTLTRRVDGPVEWTPEIFIHQRGGFEA